MRSRSALTVGCLPRLATSNSLRHHRPARGRLLLEALDKVFDLIHDKFVNLLGHLLNFLRNLCSIEPDGLPSNVERRHRIFRRKRRELVRLRRLLRSVAALLDDLRVVGVATTIPGEELRNVLELHHVLLPTRDKTTYIASVAGDTGEGLDGGNGEKTPLELLWRNVSDGISRILGGLQAEHVG